MIKEHWKAVVGYEGLYEVSDQGRIRSLNYAHTGQVDYLIPQKTEKGYLRVCLYKNGISKQWRIHRLQAIAFIPNPDNLPCVNHKNETPWDNRVENLEWCNAKYNNNYGTVKQRVSQTMRKHFSSINQVGQYSLEGTLIAVFLSVKEAAKQTRFNSINILKCCLGKIKSYKGFIWQYII